MKNCWAAKYIRYICLIRSHCCCSSAEHAIQAVCCSGTVADPVLLVRSGSQWVAYRGDWALYNGYVGETGQTMVEVRIRTAAESVSPASPKYFNLIYFAGAEPGMALTLHKECSLRPRFLSAPGFGSRIAFADVAQHRIRQSELLDALAHLFNLRFYTEEAIVNFPRFLRIFHL